MKDTLGFVRYCNNNAGCIGGVILIKSFLLCPLQPQQEDLQHGFWQVGRPHAYIVSLFSILTIQPTGPGAASISIQGALPPKCTFEGQFNSPGSPSPAPHVTKLVSRQIKSAQTSLKEQQPWL